MVVVVGADGAVAGHSVAGAAAVGAVGAAVVGEVGEVGAAALPLELAQYSTNSDEVDDHLQLQLQLQFQLQTETVARLIVARLTEASPREVIDLAFASYVEHH